MRSPLAAPRSGLVGADSPPRSRELAVDAEARSLALRSLRRRPPRLPAGDPPARHRRGFHDEPIEHADDHEPPPLRPRDEPLGPDLAHVHRARAGLHSRPRGLVLPGPDLGPRRRRRGLAPARVRHLQHGLPVLRTEWGERRLAAPGRRAPRAGPPDVPHHSHTQRSPGSDGRFDPLSRPPPRGRLDGAFRAELHSTPPTSSASSAPCSSSRPCASPMRPSSTPGARRASTCWRRSS